MVVARREFAAALASAAVAWPLAVGAQQPATPAIGFLDSQVKVATESAGFVSAFREGLKESGDAEGRNLAIEFRWAEGQLDRLAAMAADLVRRQVAVIAAISPFAAQCSKPRKSN